MSKQHQNSITTETPPPRHHHWDTTGTPPGHHRATTPGQHPHHRDTTRGGHHTETPHRDTKPGHHPPPGHHRDTTGTPCTGTPRRQIWPGAARIFHRPPCNIRRPQAESYWGITTPHYMPVACKLFICIYIYTHVALLYIECCLWT